MFFYILLNYMLIRILKIGNILADGNELTDENRYTSKPHFKCKCDKCGYETILSFDPDAPTILY